MSEIMRLKEIDLSEVVTQKFFAEIIGVSGCTVSELKSKKIIAEGQPLGEWLQRYCSHLREQSAGRAANGDLDLATERAGLAREQRLRLEMQNAVTQCEYGPISELEQGLADVLSMVSSKLDTIVEKIKKRSDILTANDLDVVAVVVAEARNDVESTTIEWFDAGEGGTDE